MTTSSCNDKLSQPIVDILATASIEVVIVAIILRQRLHGLLQCIQLVPDVEDLLHFQGAQMTLDFVPQFLQLAIPAHDFGFGALPDTFGAAGAVLWADLFEEKLQLIQRLLALLQDGFDAPTGVFFDVVAVLLRPLEKALDDWEFLKDLCELARQAICVLGRLADLDDGPGDANAGVYQSDNGDCFRHLGAVTNGEVKANWFPESKICRWKDGRKGRTAALDGKAEKAAIYTYLADKLQAQRSHGCTPNVHDHASRYATLRSRPTGSAPQVLRAAECISC
jgi:hypothetical protein